MRLHVVSQPVLPVKRRPAHNAHMFPVNVMYPHVPDELVLPPETLLAARALERPHPGVRGHVPVQLPLAHEGLGADPADVRPVPRMHRRMQPQPLEAREPFVTRQARVSLDVELRLRGFRALREAVPGYVLRDAGQAVLVDVVGVFGRLAVLFAVRSHLVVVVVRVQTDHHVTLKMEN